MQLYLIGCYSIDISSNHQINDHFEEVIVERIRLVKTFVIVLERLLSFIALDWGVAYLILYLLYSWGGSLP